jgi:hypothetical protein
MSNNSWAPTDRERRASRHFFPTVGAPGLSPARDELLFRVLATEVHNEDEEILAECARPELVGTIQAAVRFPLHSGWCTERMKFGWG